MSDVGESPNPRHREDIDGNREKNDMGPGQDENVEEPEASPVHVIGVRIFMSVTSGHHHGHHK